MGCPAKEVTGALSGSALMREPELAARLIAAAVDATARPVTLKMRLGWDEHSRNAPEIAARAEQLGVKAITVHGRTRQQFYSGSADWRAVADGQAGGENSRDRQWRHHRCWHRRARRWRNRAPTR